jgi:hypothetical protein
MRICAARGVDPGLALELGDIPAGVAWFEHLRGPSALVRRFGCLVQYATRPQIFLICAPARILLQHLALSPPPR